jgi:mRNA interferase RelE/StbE
LAWSIELTQTAEKQLKKLDRQWQQKILDYMEFEIAILENPRARGKALLGDKKGLWRYRIGSYRVICQIEDEDLTILAIMIGHRREVYQNSI